MKLISYGFIYKVFLRNGKKLIMEQKHIIFVILVLLTLGWIALSYSNIDFGANEEKILERESYRSSIDQTGKRQGRHSGRAPGSSR